MACMLIDHAGAGPAAWHAHGDLAEQPPWCTTPRPIGQLGWLAAAHNLAAPFRASRFMSVYAVYAVIIDYVWQAPPCLN